MLTSLRTVVRRRDSHKLRSLYAKTLADYGAEVQPGSDTIPAAAPAPSHLHLHLPNHPRSHPL